MRILTHADLLVIQNALVATGLANSRDALLVGIAPELVASLPKYTVAAEQILKDVDALDLTGTLSDGTVPLLTWLANACALARPRGEAEVFQRAIDQHQPSSRASRALLGSAFGGGSTSGGAGHLKVLHEASHRVTQEASTLVAHHRDDHPLLRCFGGWLGQVADQIRQRPTRLQVDAHYYQGCLSTLQGVADLNARAIADLSDTTEWFWREADPLKTTVAERIFLIDWQVMFDNVRLDALHGKLREHSERYPVKIHHVSPHEVPEPHVFGKEGFSRNLLLMKPDLVGGYVKSERDVFLRIQSDEAIYQNAEEHYARMIARALPFDPRWDRAALRQAWLTKNAIGRWNSAWGDINERSADYFEHYDLHIRCWIPEYERFVAHCAKLVEIEIAQILRGTKESIRVLEIGCGTGALTVQLAEWIQNMNRPFLDLAVAPPIDRFLAVDRSSRMVQLTRLKLGNIARTRVCEDAAPAFSSQEIKRQRPFHVICGSLVLHDLIETDPKRSMNHLLETLSRELASGGYLIFADTFFHDPGLRTRQLSAWKQAMATAGMQSHQIEEFLGHNSEMINTVTLEDLEQIGPKHGFSNPYVVSLPGARADSPFGVLIMKKD